MRKVFFIMGTVFVCFGAGWRLFTFLSYTNPLLWFSTRAWTIGTLSVFAGVLGSLFVLGILLFADKCGNVGDKADIPSLKVDTKLNWESRTPDTKPVDTKTCVGCSQSFDFSEKFVDGRCMHCCELVEESPLQDIDNQLGFLEKKKTELEEKEGKDEK